MASLMTLLIIGDERPVAEGGEGEAHAGAEGDGGEDDEQTGRAPLSVCNTAATLTSNATAIALE